METNTSVKEIPTVSSLEILKVFDRLEIGPVKVERRKLTAPYRIFQKQRVDHIDLIYHYEEDVFQPSDPASQNLADIIAAQVALNYGLFCDSIIFHGSFDSADRNFILSMAENTAREIYVIKLLKHNPFLINEAANLKPVKLPHYLQASIEFDDSMPGARKVHAGINNKWQSDTPGYAVLSSGGKDSLLSYGLLKEIGCAVHPVFVNESGRHWFTALNAYRLLERTEPDTARVWVNSDRVFAWMLRHMPFIRKDFSAVRSDEYPIRLWTVAVFLFGALPLMRKRGLGNLVIGDEFDTSIKNRHHGIVNYDGLYDQSLYFDNAMCRYFSRKGWGLYQYSIIRPLSELLIQKILVERYPELQEHQVSCHATHMVDKRALPCGKCEKCRRIVGMLKAIGADPARCGYSQEHIQNCLDDIKNKKIRQEAYGAEHLIYLLYKKGLIEFPCEKIYSLKNHPEIMKMRFCDDNARLNGIPFILRKPLYSIFQKHTEGALRKSGKEWIEFNPLTCPDINRPFFHYSNCERSELCSLICNKESMQK